MNRRHIREHVFCMLFEKDFYERTELPGQLLLYLDEVEAVQEDKDYLLERTLQVVDLTEEIDKEIDALSDGWRISRIGKTDLAILRLAIYEIRHDEMIPVSVSINEAVELAKKYGGDRSYGFINGILAKLVKEHPELLKKDDALKKKAVSEEADSDAGEAASGEGLE